MHVHTLLIPGLKLRKRLLQCWEMLPQQSRYRRLFKWQGHPTLKAENGSQLQGRDPLPFSTLLKRDPYL